MIEIRECCQVNDIHIFIHCSIPLYTSNILRNIFIHLQFSISLSLIHLCITITNHATKNKLIIYKTP